MQKFCTKCGGKLDETGRCPNCQPTKKELKARKKEQKKATKKAVKNEKWKKLSFKEKVKKICLRLLIIVLVLALVTGGATGALVYFGIIDIPVISEIFNVFGISKPEMSAEDIPDVADYSDKWESKELEDLDKEIEKALLELEAMRSDADSYFQNNSSIVSEIEADFSDNVHTEAETYSNLAGRGFTEYPIETEYSMTGEHYEPEVISDTSTSKHPYYQTSYVASNGDVWTIFEINGVVMANPVSYNVQSERDVQLIISESETVTSYDNRTNKFYETIPNESELSVKAVSRIDAETLENLTFGEIDKL